MGKKILKRSLALGALMAFVITGNAWAAKYENMVFKDRGSTGDGDLISSSTGILTINKCDFINNYGLKTDAQLYGSAVYINGGEANISNSTFLFHPYKVGTYKNVGGAIYITKAKLTFEGCTVNFDVSPYENYEYEKAGNSKHTGNSAVFINSYPGAEIHFNGKNTIENVTNSAIMGCRNEELVFKKGSETYFKNNIYDFVNILNVNILEEALLVAQDCIDVQSMQMQSKSTLEFGGGIVWHEHPYSTIGTLSGNGGTLKFMDKATLYVTENNCKEDQLTLLASGVANDAVDGDANLLVRTIDAYGADGDDKTGKTKIVMAQGDLRGEITADLIKNNDKSSEYYGNLMVDPANKPTEKPNTKNQAITDNGVALKLHWRSHLSDMNKRMGELRDAHGELGVWTRVVRGENEYKGTKAQYNQYQLGYDERLSVDKRWIVGAAVTFADGDASYGYGSTEDKSTAFTVYGTKLNSDGSYVDLIARYEHMESDLKDANSRSDNYCANGMSVGAEFGKRFDQKDGAWIEPQVQLTYGTVDSAEFQLGGKTVRVGDMDSLIGRVGFRLGQDIEQGNIYAKASYLYDFDGKTEAAFSNANNSRTFKEDLGGGWWEVGVGANISLSKATYIYADIEKTFGGEVDTNWQWNLGVRYSF